MLERKITEVGRDSRIRYGYCFVVSAISLHQLSSDEAIMLKLITVLFLVGVAGTGSLHSAEECDVAEVYQSLDVPSGTICMTALGGVEEPKLILVPKKLDTGNYEVTVTRRAQDLYEVDGYGLYVKTRYCYEYAYSADAVLKYKSKYGYTKGALIFLE